MIYIITDCVYSRCFLSLKDRVYISFILPVNQLL